MANNTTTRHIEALIVEDGHGFAMIRKDDLRALWWACKSSPYQGRYVDQLGVLEREMTEVKRALGESEAWVAKMMVAARTHGDHRRRYMANNKALLARIAQLEAQANERV